MFELNKNNDNVKTFFVYKLSNHIYLLLLITKDIITGFVKMVLSTYNNHTPFRHRNQTKTLFLIFIYLHYHDLILNT